MPTKRQVFYSFHYQPDNWRAAQVRNIGLVEGNNPTSDNDWEYIARNGDPAIQTWINKQLEFKSCTIVLVGANTANRKWINYEIIKSWKKGIGVAGIYIHGLKNKDGNISQKGNNPFDFINYGERRLSEIVKCYDPSGINSQEKYGWIRDNLTAIIEEAINIRNRN